MAQRSPSREEYVNRIESLRDLIEGYDREIHHCDVRIYRRLNGNPGYEAVQALLGGPVLAAVFSPRWAP